MNTVNAIANMSKNNTGYPKSLENLEQQINNTEKLIKNANSANNQGAGINKTNLATKLANLQQKYRSGIKNYLSRLGLAR